MKIAAGKVDKGIATSASLEFCSHPSAITTLLPSECPSLLGLGVHFMNKIFFYTFFYTYKSIFIFRNI